MRELPAGDTAELEVTLGWTFADRRVLTEALTHSTYANENLGAGPDNERLEFLGDAVLGLLVASLLYDRPGQAGEGEMSKRRARVVRRQSLAALARELELGRFLRLGQGQRRSGGTENILADAYEALVGAVFVDGGYEAVQRCFGPALHRALEAAADRIDFKTRLQELCHARGEGPPTYAVVRVEGPGHALRFRCEVRIGAAVVGEGEGSSKKRAEQACAEQALRMLEPGAP